MNPTTNPSVSVVVPTYNRAASLLRLLETLCRQTYPLADWEVIVVNDGSSDPQYQGIDISQYPFNLCILRQSNAGAPAARNSGAIHSTGDILIFLDDDIIIEPTYISDIVEVHKNHPNVIVAGRFVPYLTGDDPPFRSACARSGVTQTSNESTIFSFRDVVSHNFSIKRQDFFEIGMFQDPTSGKFFPNWDDIDIAYRAHKAGYKFFWAGNHNGCHADLCLSDFDLHCKRVYRAGASAVYLFEKYPELADELPMFRDKAPINLREDDLGLIIRKSLRVILANGTILHNMHRLINYFEKSNPDSKILIELYRWVNSSYIYQGYRDNLNRHLAYD